jgi:hypothetical protein
MTPRIFWDRVDYFIVVLIQVIIDGLSLSLMKGSYDLIVFLFLVADHHGGRISQFN